MANDIFGRLALELGGAFSADAAVATFGGIAGGGVGLLTQQINFTYQQNVTRLFEVGSRLVYYIVGRSQGSLSAQRVLGPRPVSLAFYAAYGNPCNSANNTLVFQVGVGCTNPGDTEGSISLTLTGVLLQSIGISVQAENMIVNESLQALFVALTV